MRRVGRLVGAVGLAAALSAEPAHAATRTAAAALQGSGSIQRDIFTGAPTRINATGTGTGVMDDLPVQCNFFLSAPLSGQVRYQGPGEFSCIGIGPFGSLAVNCTVFVTITGVLLDGVGTCEGNARGPLALAMVLIPTSLSVTDPLQSFGAVGTFTVRINMPPTRQRSGEAALDRAF